MALVALLGEDVQGHSGEVVKVDTLKGHDLVGIYFSAHWCPPCRGFTPELVKWYKNLKDNNKKVEIVFVSSDRDEAAFNQYFNEMPWLALAYDNRAKKEELSKKYGVTGIPCLVFVNPATGETQTKDGRAVVMGDKNGEKFPYK